MVSGEEGERADLGRAVRSYLGTKRQREGLRARQTTFILLDLARFDECVCPFIGPLLPSVVLNMNVGL